ncbi:MAG: zinc-binding dehydrogenase [Anaerolineaceae bacterium]|jgi:L-iditol 2-dehydrogenase|nr:zinc-binding dehydrogenase [Anaerolineaceae bacterium]
MEKETMKAITFVDTGKLEMREYPIPKPQYGQVLVRIMTSALCTIDQRAFRGDTTPKFPVVQGHEAMGEVVEVGEGVDLLQLGDHVVIGRNHCHSCHYCRKNTNHCLNRRYSNKKFSKAGPDDLKARMGLMAEYTVMDVTNLAKVSKDVLPEWAALSEPISCVLHSIKRSRLKAGETCVVIGAGIMGLLHVQIAKEMGAKVIVSEPDAHRRERALQCGADFVVDPTKEDPVMFVMNNNGGFGADVVFYAIAISSVFPQSMEMLDHAGRIICYSSQHPEEPVAIKVGAIHSSEKEIIGSLGSTMDDFSRATQLLDENKLKMDLVIDHIVPFENYLEAFEKSIIPGTYRVVLKMK